MLFLKRKYPHDYFTDQTYLSGLLTGVVAGLAVGFLFAPRSGKALRRQIADTVSNQTKEVQHQLDNAKAQARESLDNIKSNVNYVNDKAQDEFNDYAHEAENKAGQLADEAKSGIDKIKDTLRIS